MKVETQKNNQLNNNYVSKKNKEQQASQNNGINIVLLNFRLEEYKILNYLFHCSKIRLRACFYLCYVIGIFVCFDYVVFMFS
jgi:hypothetical protein